MRFVISCLFSVFLAVSALPQESNKFLKIEGINFYSSDFQMMNNSTKISEVGGDSTQFSQITTYRDSSTTKQIPPTVSQLEDRKFNHFSSSAKVSDNQHLSVLFSNLSGKPIKSVSLLFRLSQNGKKLIEKKINSKPRFLPDGRFYLSSRFFSSKNLSKLITAREIIIKKIEFSDGTKLKF